MQTLDASVSNVLSRLDDPLGERYSRQSAIDGIEEGYNVLLRRTECMWDAEFYESQAAVGNVTSQWERAYLVPLTEATCYQGVVNFTGGHWEREYVGPDVFYNGAYGPVQATALWEAQHEYVEEVIPAETFELPEGLVRMDRVTFDSLTLDPQLGPTLRRDFVRYKEHDSGTPSAFVMDEDGLRYFRITRSPGGVGTLYTYDGHRGILRYDDEGELADTDTVGTRGILRATDDDLRAGHHRGGPVRLCSDSDNTRIEFFRLGKDLSSGYGFELPARYIRSVEDYACSRLLSDEGPGQDITLSSLYASRFESTVERLRDRINSFSLNRKAALGSNPSTAAQPPVARLPWSYPNG